jgi:predicted SprT family Zn-dependent metalloprotease
MSLKTPPSSPTRVRVRSPTKEKIRIPPTPYRESVDAFWSQTETNHWIDQHSPRKEKTPGRSVIELLKDFDISDEEDSSCNSSISLLPGSMSRARITPPKTPDAPKTPSKTAIKKAEADAKREARARRDSFNNKKASFAATFLEVLDNAVSGGKVQLLAEPTGGVKITWSKTLQKTAGRAQWRSERVETRSPDGQRTGATQHIHYATIELAERIIDDEYRLINTLAHEYCHLANFMVSRVTDNPHGASFKHWGKLCAEKLKDHPIYGGRINVTTKHSYKIDWKYVWACSGCGVTYGRHSKSIDPESQRCGTCKHRLEQIKPKPRMSPQKKAMAQVTKSLAQIQVEM